MPIFNNACVQDPITFDATIWPSSIRYEAIGETLLFPQPRSTSQYVPPSILFGSLVFEHQENIDRPFIKAKGPNPIHVETVPIDPSSDQISIEQDGGYSFSFDNSKDEVHHVQDCHICAMSQHREVIHTKRPGICTSLRFDERSETIHFVEIAQPRLYMKPCSGGWIDDSMPIKKGDPGCPVVSIVVGQHQFNEAIHDISSSVNIIPKIGRPIG